MNLATRIFALLVTCVGVVVPFLPFTWDVSPLDTFKYVWPLSRDSLFALLGAPFFLPIAILFWHLRRLAMDRLSTVEIAVAYLFSFAAMLSVLVFVALEWEKIGNLTGMGITAITAALIAGNLLLVIRNHRAMVSRESAAEAFLLGGYLPNAIFCILIFSEWRSAGSRLALAVCVGYVAVMVLLSRTQRHPLAAASQG